MAGGADPDNDVAPSILGELVGKPMAAPVVRGEGSDRLFGLDGLGD